MDQASGDSSSEDENVTSYEGAIKPYMFEPTVENSESGTDSDSSAAKKFSYWKSQWSTYEGNC